MNKSNHTIPVNDEVDPPFLTEQEVMVITVIILKTAFIHFMSENIYWCMMVIN